MASRICWTKLIPMILAGLMIALAGPGCSETSGSRIPISTGDGGWEHIQNLPLPSYVSDISFVDGKTGWGVGSGGLVLKTTNGGATWSPQGFDLLDVSLRSVWFTDANNGCVVGTKSWSEQDSLIFRTTDGGVTWNQCQTPKGLFLTSLCFSDPMTGWAVGTVGRIIGQRRNEGCRLIKTTDGGATWSIISSVPLEFFFQKVLFVDAQHGWVWEGDRSSSIVRTVDGGKTWSKPITIPDRCYINSVCFVDPKNGWACGRAKGGRLMLHTTDGGDTWTRQTNGIPWAPKNASYRAFDSVHFADAKNGWACGTEGTIARTTDGGENWTMWQTETKDPNLALIRFADAKTGWALSSYGTLLTTTDGGNTWASSGTPLLHDLFAVQFLDSQTGWMVGCSVRPQLGGEILKTTDGGLTWVQQKANTGDWLNKLSMIDHQHGWAVGDNGAAFTTDDGGATWVKRTSWLNGLSSVKTGICQAQFVDSKFGWIVVGDISDPSQSVYSIRRTSDGGATWQTLSTGTLTPINDMWFVDRKTGWEVGPKGTLLKTTDGGNSWTRKFTGTTKHLAGVYFTDPHIGWIVGQDGLVMKSTDGGETWTIQEFRVKDHLRGVCFSDASRGWIGSVGKYILMTTDGGRTWVKQDVLRGSGAYWHLSFIDSDRGWMPGPSLLRTTTGGLPGIVWAKKQPDGKAANFGHLVVIEMTSDGIYAVHPDSRIGMRFRIKYPEAKVGDYIYIHGKVASDGDEKVIDADSIDVITAGWGVIKENNNEKQAQLH